MRFQEVRSKVIQSLVHGTYFTEARADREVKNWLYSNRVSEAEVVEMIKACTGRDHEASPHHKDAKIVVHILKPQGRFRGWYLKFYFVDPDTVFISVHR